MAEGFVIRKAKGSDAMAAREVVFPVLEHYGLAPEPQGTDADLFDLDAAYFRAGGAFFVLEDPAGRVVGTCGLKPIDRERIELRKMYLSPAARGQGHGRRLLEHAIAEARRLGFRKLELETASVLVEAISLYRSRGFVPRCGGVETKRCDQAYTLDL